MPRSTPLPVRDEVGLAPLARSGSPTGSPTGSPAGSSAAGCPVDPACDHPGAARPAPDPTPARDAAAEPGLDPELWRRFPDLAHRARYIDIETTGLDERDWITLVGVSDGATTRVLVRGLDLTRERLGELLADAALLVTFNGERFDLPRLARGFPGLPWSLPHLDLAREARRVGLGGGLKAIERELGHRRLPELEGLDGAEAVRLWRAHQAGDLEALPRLVRYCRADVESLVQLAPPIYARLRAALPRTGAQPAGAPG